MRYKVRNIKIFGYFLLNIDQNINVLIKFVFIFPIHYSNTVLMQYDGGSSGYGSGGNLGNSLFPRYKHHKLNLNSLKNFGYIHIATTSMFISIFGI